jgi:hypothetical protein
MLSQLYMPILSIASQLFRRFGLATPLPAGEVRSIPDPFTTDRARRPSTAGLSGTRWTGEGNIGLVSADIGHEIISFVPLPGTWAAGSDGSLVEACKTARTPRSHQCGGPTWIKGQSLFNRHNNAR